MEFVLISYDASAMTASEFSFDFIIRTIPDACDVNLYISLLKKNATLIAVGVLASYATPTNNMQSYRGSSTHPHNPGLATFASNLTTHVFCRPHKRIAKENHLTS